MEVLTNPVNIVIYCSLYSILWIAIKKMCNKKCGGSSKWANKHDPDCTSQFVLPGNFCLEIAKNEQAYYGYDTGPF